MAELEISEPKGGWRKPASFSADERQKLWPMAETLAMLDRNAFFVQDGKYQWDWVACYLTQAHALYEANGGDDGWAGEALFARFPQSLPFGNDLPSRKGEA